METLTDAEWVAHFGRFEPLPGQPGPVAMRYHGHQFRVYNPDLGDGRGFTFAQMRATDGRLLELGFLPVVWNRSPDKAVPLVAQGARWSDNPLAECDRVIISLFTSDIVAEVLEQMGSALRAGHYLIDTTTGEPDVVLRLGQRLAGTGDHRHADRLRLWA